MSYMRTITTHTSLLTTNVHLSTRVALVARILSGNLIEFRSNDASNIPSGLYSYLAFKAWATHCPVGCCFYRHLQESLVTPLSVSSL